MADSPDAFTQIQHHLPGALLITVLSLLALAFVVDKLKPLGGPLRWLWELTGRRLPSLSAEQRTRVRRRRKLARRVEWLLRIDIEQARWDERRFTELEAQVATDAARRRPSTENSLTHALERSKDPIIVLEGEPGSGKSVAMRHLALRTVTRATHSARRDAPIPLYVDLKGFRPDGEPTPDAVHDYVFNTLTRFRDRELEEIAQTEFSPGLDEGGWLLLFDGFDEIPAVLGATESDGVVHAYAQAIILFVQARECRAVIASREFRGPTSFGLPTFTVLRLTAKQQRTLIKRSGLEPDLQHIAIEGVESVSGGPGNTSAGAGSMRGGALSVGERPDLAPLVGNPLFLSLLCEHVRVKRVFPESVHTVFESFVDHRFASDTVRIEERFALLPDQLRAYAEEIAFCMAAEPELGLDPMRKDLRAAVQRGERVDMYAFDQAVEALEYLRLTRPRSQEAPAGGYYAGLNVDDGGSGDAARFSFMHRRIQEYFVSCVVLREPDRVSPRALLTDGHWRETAVTILQLAPPASMEPLLTQIEVLLTAAVLQARLTPEVGSPATEADGEQPESRVAPAFCWPPGALYLLEILAAGFSRKPDAIPRGIRLLAGRILAQAWGDGRREDRLWAIDVVLTAPKPLTTRILVEAFESKSALLRLAAFRHAVWLDELTEGVRVGIRMTLLSQWATGELAAAASAIRGQIWRLPDAADLRVAYRIARTLTATDITLLTATSIPVLILYPTATVFFTCLTIAASLHILLFLAVTSMVSGVARKTKRLNFIQYVANFSFDLVEGEFGSTVSIFLVFYLRICTAIFVTLILLLTTKNLIALSMFISTFAMTWTPAAVQLLRHDRPIRTSWWIIAPAVRLVTAVRRAPRQTTVILFGLLLTTGAAWAWNMLHAGRHFKWAQSWTPYILGVFAGSGTLALAISWGAKVVQRLSTGSQLRAYSAKTTPYSVDELTRLLKLMAAHRSIAEFTKSLSSIPERLTNEVVDFLSDLGDAADRFNGDLAELPSYGAVLENWRNGDSKSLVKVFEACDEEAMDEIARLVSARRKPSVQGIQTRVAATE